LVPEISFKPAEKIRRVRGESRERNSDQPTSQRVCNRTAALVYNN
jgi:hypothetical protein